MPTAQDRVAAALEAVPRRWFLPPGQVGHAWRDVPLPIGHGQTSSQPSTVRAMLELLDVQVGDRVLDVGAGSGWTTALLAALVGPAGAVTGVERVPELRTAAASAVAATGMPWARVVAAEPGVLGWPEGAPYQRILVSAQPRSLPDELVAQLAPGGVLVIPVAGRMLRVVNQPDQPGGPVVQEHGWYRFVPLVSDPGPGGDDAR